MTSHRDPTHKRKFDLQELGLGLLAFLVLGLTAALAFVVINQQSNGSGIDDIKQTNQILIDCTTPGHRCFENNKSSTGKLILNLIQSQRDNTIKAAHCTAIGYTSVSSIKHCMDKGN